MKRLFVMAERSKSMSTPSRDEELYPLPGGKWCKTLKEAFFEAETGNLIGYFLGWEKHVYMLTAKKWVRITKVTEQMIYEDELHEALEGLKAAYYDTDAFTSRPLLTGDSVPLNEDVINSVGAALQRRKEQYGNPEQE